VYYAHTGTIVIVLVIFFIGLVLGLVVGFVVGRLSSRRRRPAAPPDESQSFGPPAT
jgi:uncharacterized membrane-anchored protein YhcB (DUF1043 family)